MIELSINEDFAVFSCVNMTAICDLFANQFLKTNSSNGSAIFNVSCVFSINLNFIAGGDFPNLNIDPSVLPPHSNRSYVIYAKNVFWVTISCHVIRVDTDFAFFNTCREMHIPAGIESVPT